MYRGIMEGSEHAPKRAVYRMPIRDLKAQIARLPEQPGVYLYYNEAGETLYVGKARVLRDRVRSYLGAHGTSPRIDALLDEAAAARGHRHRLGGRGAGAREPPDQAAGAEVQHPAARRQELSLPAADDRRGVSAGPRRPPRRARRALLRRPVHARLARPPDDGADAPAVRHPVLQRGDHRRARRGPASSSTSSGASRRASARSARPRTTASRSSTRSCSSKGATTSSSTTLRDRMTDGRRGRALRAGGAAARRDPHDRDAAARGSRRWSSAELGDRDAFGLKIGPAGAVVQVFQVRGRQVIERIELVTDGGERLPRRSPEGEGGSVEDSANAPPLSREQDVLQAALQQFYADRSPPPEIHLPLDLGEADADRARGVAVVASRHGACGSSCRSAARSAACSTSRRATPRSRIRRASTRTSPPTTTRSRRCARSSPCPPSRAASSASTSRRSRAAKPWRRWSCAKTAG